MTVSTYLRCVWRWVAVVAFIGLGGCGGVQAPAGPAPALPPGCIDEFSGYPTRGCF